MNWYFTKSWKMTPTRARSASGSHSCNGRPSSVIEPRSGAYRRVSSLISVVFPDPLCPTSASRVPGRTWNDTPRIAGSEAPG